MKTLTQFIKENANSKTCNGFCILKPEFGNHKDEWLKMLADKGWEVLNQKTFTMSHDLACDLYYCHKDKDFYGDLCDYMSSGDCTCCSVHKDCDDPVKDMSTFKDEIRNKWGIDDMKNAMHSSDSLENVNRETRLIFDCKN